MRQYLLILVLLVAFSSCEMFRFNDQQSILFFEQDEISKVLSKDFSLSSDTSYFKGTPSRFICPESTECKKLTRFLLAVRKKENELPLIAKYYFGEDSVVKFIQYEWSQTVPGLTVEEREQKMVVESKKFDVYVSKLNAVAAVLEEQMGKPVSNDGEIKKDETSLLDIYKYQISFVKDKKHVDLKLIWSPKRGARFFKVWSKVYWVE